MNITLTGDDVMAATAVGGFVLTPVIAYIKFVHGQQSAAWKAIDRLRDDIALCMTRAEHDKYRVELKADLSTMEERIIKEMERLVGNK